MATEQINYNIYLVCESSYNLINNFIFWTKNKMIFNVKIQNSFFIILCWLQYAILNLNWRYLPTVVLLWFSYLKERKTQVKEETFFGHFWFYGHHPTIHNKMKSNKMSQRKQIKSSYKVYIQQNLIYDLHVT